MGIPFPLLNPSKRIGELQMATTKKVMLRGLLALTALLPAWSWAAEMGADETKVVDTMHALFTAMEQENLDQFHHVTCPNFYLFDNGKQLSGDGVMNFIKKAHASGTSFVWQVTQPQVYVDGNTAWITYINQGSITNAAGKKDMKWLESAVLNKTADGWCIHFAHSTREQPGS
jgi:ketosteroid isomerase-like protein